MEKLKMKALNNMNDLTLEGLVKGHRMITDDTQIIIRDSKNNVVAVGKWFEDGILEKADKPVESLSYWADRNRLHIALK